jgi:phosphoribosylformylglycinamidine cyclo-ligase
MTEIPKVPEVFNFIMKHGPVELKEAYGTFNMGAGFAVYIDRADVDRAIKIAGQTGYHAWLAGIVEKRGNEKRVEIEPLKISFEAESLQLR